MLVEEQISARQQRAKATIQRVLAQPAGKAYGDYEVQSASGRKYRVAMRGPNLFENFRSCPDFAVNTLGTCSTSKPCYFACASTLAVLSIDCDTSVLELRFHCIMAKH
jgi:hypothetical protein